VAVWFKSSKVDHPLAEPKDSRKIISELPQDSIKALGEVAYWLDSVHSTAGFRVDRRIELIDEFEQYARPRLRKLGQDYLQVRQQKFQENRLWVAQADYWRLAGAVYLQCVEGVRANAPGAGAVKARTPVIVGRALRALGQQLKWLMLRYGPVDPSVWGHLGSLYAFAESAGIATKEVDLYEGGHDRTSARHELLRILMLFAAATDSLLPVQVEIAERSVAWFVRDFLLEVTPEAGCTHVFDIAKRGPPARPHGAAMEASLRFFGAGRAFDEIDRLRRIVVNEGALPRDVNLGGEFDPKDVAEVWRRLLQYWALKPPERASERRAVNVRLTIVQGLDNVITNMDPAIGGDLDFSTKGPVIDSESWVAVNASDGGYGAVVPEAKSDWVQVGSLVGVKAEAEKYWSVGVIRRVTRDAEHSRHVGIELLTRAALPVQLSPVAPISAANALLENDPGILLTRKADADRQVRVLMRGGSYTPGQRIELRARGQAYQLTPTKLLASEIEFDLGQFTLVQRVT
jgi:hypothetical protein